MWVDKLTLQWNPWDTDKHQKKRWCHIRGMQKMNEYHLMKQKQENDKMEKEQKDQKRRSGKGSSSSRKYPNEFNKLSYVDKDMQKLVNENKGTTSAYDYAN